MMLSYKELKNDTVPNRLRKINFDDLLIPKTNYCEQFCNYGLYILLFQNYKKYYDRFFKKYFWFTYFERK